MAETDGSGVVTKTFAWGLDLSGSQQGAGGVGGLLIFRDVAGSKNYYAYSDGNGNVSKLVTGAAGAIAAEYEYSPFGEVLAQSGGAASLNPLQWSSKYADPDTKLSYYGYRFYSPIIGRWLNRDPLEERGGTNLYAFLENDGIGKRDYLGLAYGTHLTKEEAEQLSCALRFWLNRAKVANLLILWGSSDRSLTLKFLSRYLDKEGGRIRLPYSAISNNNAIQAANARALRRPIVSVLGMEIFGSWIESPIVLGNDLGTSLGRVAIYYQRHNWNKISASIRDHYTFLDTEEGSPLNVLLPFLDTEGDDVCCWRGGNTITDLWMGDLETYGFAKSFWVDIDWSLNNLTSP